MISVAIFGYRENLETLLEAVSTAISALNKCGPFQIHILINGNDALAKAVKTSLGEVLGVKVWSFELGDKSNCWNQYIYRISENADFHFFLDGYVFVNNDSFDKVIRFAKQGDAKLYTGIPSGNRSAEVLANEMINHGGIHGNFYALTRSGYEAVKSAKFKLPLRLYRTDSLLGAVINFNLSPENYEWDSSRIGVVVDATWRVPRKSIFSLRNLIDEVKRRLRQGRGAIENKAYEYLLRVQKTPVGELGDYAPITCRNFVLKSRITKKSLFTFSPSVFLAQKYFLKGDLNKERKQSLLLADRFKEQK